MKHLHKAWINCIGCALIIFCTSGLVTNAFSIYLPFILKVNDFTNTQVSLLITIRSLIAFVSMFFIGFYYKKLNIKKGITLAGFSVAAGFIILGFARSYAAYITGFVFLGFGYGLGTMIPVSTLLKRWFLSDFATATGICACITSFSTLGFPNIISASCTTLGLGKTFVVEGIICALIIFIAGLLLCDSPEKWGVKPYEKKQYKGDRDNCFSQDKGDRDNCQYNGDRDKCNNTPAYSSLLTRKLCYFLLPVFIITGGYTTVSYSNLSLLITGKGFSPQVAATISIFSGIALMCSKYLYGFLAEHINSIKTDLLLGPLTILGFILMNFGGSSEIFLCIAVILYSLGLSRSTVGLIIMAKELSSEQDFEHNNQVAQIGYVAGNFVFSALPGILADRFSGSYIPAFNVFCAGAVICFVVIQIIYRKAKNN